MSGMNSIAGLALEAVKHADELGTLGSDLMAVVLAAALPPPSLMTCTPCPPWRHTLPHREPRARPRASSPCRCLDG